MKDLIDRLLPLHIPGGTERCGVITLLGEIIELPNLSPTPYHDFEMDLSTLREEAVATWHTHPSGSGNLSIQDYHMMRSFPHLWHYIIGADRDVRCYHVENDMVLQHESDDPV